MTYTRVHAHYVSVVAKGILPVLSPNTHDTQDGLAIAGNAPSILKRTLSNGLPITALVVSSLFSLLAYMGVHAGSGKVFGWFANMTAVAGLLTWFGISYTYTRFYAGMKIQGIDRENLPFKSPLQPFAAWYATVSCLLISFVRGGSPH